MQESKRLPRIPEMAAGLSSKEHGRDYSIIVCTHNRSSLLEKCLKAVIREMKASKVSGELVLVDNASTDQTKYVVDTLSREVADVRLRYFFEGEPNLCIARNRGIDESKGDILIFLDDDAIPSMDWLRSYLSGFADNQKVLAIGGKVAPLLEEPAPDWFRPPLSGMFTIMDLGGSSVRTFPLNSHPVGANMAYRRSVFATRRFSPRLGRSGSALMSGDEAEICASIRDDGGELLYVPGMRVEHFIHPERLTKQWVRDRYYFEGVSRARMHFGWPVPAITIVKQIAKLSLLMLAYPFHRTSYQKLKWSCSVRWSVGYMSELAGLSTFAMKLLRRFD
jgi:glycosyltransferase involved in cell wall biosynthesis